MTIFHKIIKWWSNLFRSIKSDNKKQLLELERLEKKIDELETQKSEKDQNKILPSNRMFLKFWLIGLVVVFLAFLIFKSLNIIFLILTAYIVSLAVEGVIDFFQNKLSHRWIAIFLTYLLLVALVLWWFVFIIPFLLNQVSGVINMLTANVSNIQTLLETQSLSSIISDISWLPWSIKHTLINSMADPTLVSGIQTKLQENISQIVNITTTYARDIWNFAVSFVWWFFTFIAQTSIVLTLSVLFSIQKTSVMKFLSWLWWEKHYNFYYMKLERIYKKLWIWLKSQLLLCIFIWLTLYLWLWILSWCGIDIPYKWSLAIIAWITELIPYIWPIIGWFVAVLVGLINVWPTAALFVLWLVVVIQWIENNVLIPLLMNKTLGVNPVVIFISMIIWWLVMWIVGVLLAVPIAVIITMMLEKTFD